MMVIKVAVVALVLVVLIFGSVGVCGLWQEQVGHSRGCGTRVWFGVVLNVRFDCLCVVLLERCGKNSDGVVKHLVCSGPWSGPRACQCHARRCPLI